jgi:integrase
MPVTIFRWHTKHCPHKPEGRKYDRCGCPLWADGKPLKEKRSLGTRDRGEALQLARELELNGGVMVREETGPVTYVEAKEIFFREELTPNLQAPTLRKHETLHKQLAYFLTAHKVSNLKEITRAAASKFYVSWYDKGAYPVFDSRPGVKPRMRAHADSKHAALKKLERLTQFFAFALKRKWIDANPADKHSITRPEYKKKQTEAFELEMFESLLATARKWIAEAPSYSLDNCKRLYALILFLRYSGLRIGDAISCRVEWVKDGRVERITMKNQAEINVKLPPIVIEALAGIPKTSESYFFWTGNGLLDSAVKDWQGKIKELCEDAGIVKGHAHRLRHTFVLALLEQKKSWREIAELLGDTVDVVIRNYNPKSKVRQEGLDDAVESTWTNDATLRKLEAEGRGKGKVRQIRRLA